MEAKLGLVSRLGFGAPGETRMIRISLALSVQIGLSTFQLVALSHRQFSSTEEKVGSGIR